MFSFLPDLQKILKDLVRLFMNVYEIFGTFLGQPVGKILSLKYVH